MQFTTNNRDRLLEMKPSKDTVWAAVKTPVFKMHDGYFGHYSYGDPDDPWTVDCIKGVSPEVFKPQELTYAGRFDMPDSRVNYLFVFSAKNDDLCYHGRVMPWYYNRFVSFYDAKQLSGGTFYHFLAERNMLDFNKVFFGRDECAEKCRELNKNFSVSDAIGSFGKWYEKTLEDMQKQLTECLNADYVVDPVEKLKKTVEGKNED